MKSPHRTTLVRLVSFFAVGLLLGRPAWVWSQSITATVSVGAAPEAVAVNKVTNKIYVADLGGISGNGVVTVIDGTTHATTTVQVGVNPRAVAVNEATNKIYVANCGRLLNTFSAGSITVIDAVTNSTATVVDPNAKWPCSLAVNPASNKVYVGNRLSGNVTVVDGTTNSTTTVTDPNASQNGLGAAAVAVNPVTNKVYVANNSTDHGGNIAGNVTVIDGATNLTITVTDPHAFGPNAVAVNTVTNKIYVTNGGAYPAANHGNVTVIDGASNSAATISDPNALFPQSVAVNQTTNKIYVANGNDPARTGIGGVTVIDGTTNAISTVRDPNAMFPHALSVDSVTDMIYVANEGCFPPADPCTNPGSVTVINGATNSTTTIIDPQAHNPEVVAVNPIDNQIYVANIGSGNVTVIDGGGTATGHTLGVVLSGSGNGTVTSNPLGINCGTTCIESVPAGTAVSLNALASSGSAFAGWSGPCTGTGSCDLVMNGDQFVTAAFSSTNPPPVAVPNVVSLTQAAATTAITGAGLTVGTVSMQSSTTVPSGGVISESPAADTNVASGSAVNLVVSTGGSSGGGSGGGYGGGGGIDALTLGALLSLLIVALRGAGVSSYRQARPRIRSEIGGMQLELHRPTDFGFFGRGARFRRNNMNARIVSGISAMVLLTSLTMIPVRLVTAQDNHDNEAGKLITFDAPGAGTGSGQGTFGLGINPAGTIAGSYQDANNVYHGFLRAPDGSITTFDAPGEGTGPFQGTIAFGLSQEGAIAAYYIDASNVNHGFLRAPDGSITTFDAPGAGTGSGPGGFIGDSNPGTQAESINPAGAIAGQYRDASNVYHGFLRASDGTFTTFDAPGAGTDPFQGTITASFSGLNPAGAIVGWYVDASNVNHGYVRARDGTFTTFEAPGAGTDSGQGTILDSINPAGATTGYYFDASNVSHGLLRTSDGAITTFEAPGAGTGPGQGTFGGNINPAGAIAGSYIDASNVSHGFVRTAGGTIATFDVPGAGTGPFQGTFPFSNNPAGQISGYYIDASNMTHSFLRTPRQRDVHIH